MEAIRYFLQIQLNFLAEIFPLVGFMNAFKEPLAASKSCERMCNELVADLTGLDIERKPEEGTLNVLVVKILY